MKPNKESEPTFPFTPKATKQGGRHNRILSPMAFALRIPDLGVDGGYYFLNQPGPGRRNIQKTGTFFYDYQNNPLKSYPTWPQWLQG